MELRQCFLPQDEVERRSDETGLHCLDESLALDSQREESDINTIVKRFGLTGQIPQAQRMPVYGDFTEGVSDYRTALDAVNAADRAFMSLSPDVRRRFGGDPQMLLEFVSDPANLEEARKLGLAKPAPKVEDVVPPVAVPVEKKP